MNKREDTSIGHQFFKTIALISIKRGLKNQWLIKNKLKQFEITTKKVLKSS